MDRGLTFCLSFMFQFSSLSVWCRVSKRDHAQDQNSFGQKGKSTLQPIAALFVHADLLKKLLLQGISGFVMHSILLTLIIWTAGQLWFQYNWFHNSKILQAQSLHTCITANMNTMTCAFFSFALWTLCNSIMVISKELITGYTDCTESYIAKVAIKNSLLME